MTSSPSQGSDKRIEPKRAEMVAIGGLVLQAFATLIIAILASFSESSALGVIWKQSAIGIFFWLITWLHLRMRRSAREEVLDLQEAEKRRRNQGVEALFEDNEKGLAERNLSHMDRYIAPAASLLLSFFLIGPLVYVLGRYAFMGISVFDTIGAYRPVNSEYALVSAAFCICISLGLFLMGTYASGLSRETNFALLRAGAGYMRTTALFLFATAIALAITNRGWLSIWPDRAVMVIVIVWMTLQTAEIVSNFIFDFYRPRIAGVESRPAYDSRLSGLFAEPQGIFRTFSHTMDYQFGFKVSETWFFRFLEKAFAPLILIQLFTFYMLTCFVVVAPGEVAIIELWGAPRGVSDLPAQDADWDKLSKPLEARLHLKLPWPIETYKIIKRDQIRTIHAGFEAVSGYEALHIANELAGKTVSWDQEHVKGEYKYLMPLPQEMRSGGSLPEEAAKASTAKRPDNVLFLSGTFSIDYRIGDKKGDVYRFAYRHQNPEETLRNLFESEITAYMAGAQFWDLMIKNPEEAHKRIRAGLQSAADREGMGVSIMNVFIQNIHPPVGDVGKSYQEVLASRQKTKGLIYDGEIEQKKILGLMESQENGILSKAESYKVRRELVASAESLRFENQIRAYLAAPEVYKARLRLQAIEEGIGDKPLTVRPSSMDVWFDMTKLPDMETMEIQKGVAKAVKDK
ncbi:MAG: hypothetical protein JXR97_01960 [Planctomycetes bacterium]|nr:hypothetical protein [Planctomycetota bacterium]